MEIEENGGYESLRAVCIEIIALVSAVRDWAGLPDEMLDYDVFVYLDKHKFWMPRNRRIALRYREAAVSLCARYSAANRNMGAVSALETGGDM